MDHRSTMSRKRKNRAQRRARERQANGDVRPYMMILHEEQVIENIRRPVLKGRPTVKLELPDEIDLSDE
jgi:hypothetical protein